MQNSEIKASYSSRFHRKKVIWLLENHMWLIFHVEWSESERMRWSQSLVLVPKGRVGVDCTEAFGFFPFCLAFHEFMLECDWIKYFQEFFHSVTRDIVSLTLFSFSVIRWVLSTHLHELVHLGYYKGEFHSVNGWFGKLTLVWCFYQDTFSCTS